MFSPFCFLFYGAFVLAVIAKKQVCGVCTFPLHQPLLIWGGNMNLALVNATLLIDLGKCLAASIHLLMGNVIMAWIILLFSLCYEYATFPQLTTSSMSYGNKQTHGIGTPSRHVFLQTMQVGVGAGENWRCMFLNSCMTLCKSLCLSEPESPHLKMGQYPCAVRLRKLKKEHIRHCISE